MAERILKTPQGRLNNFDRRKDEHARKRYIDEVLGDAGVTDFSNEARQKLEDLTEYDEYMQRFSKDQRDPLDRHIDAVDNGLVDSKEAKQSLPHRRIAQLALEIAQMEADGTGERVADNTGKTVLDYRKDRLTELQNKYASSTAMVRDVIKETQSSPTTTGEKTATADPAYAEEDEVEDYPESDGDEAPQSDQDKTGEGVEPTETATPPHTPRADGDPNAKSGEAKKDDDSYKVGSTVRAWIDPINKQTGEARTQYSEYGFAIISKKLDDERFEIELKDINGQTNKHIVTRDYLDASKKMILPEFAHDSNGKLLNPSQPTNLKEWAVIGGPDEDNEFTLTDGKKTIHRKVDSLALWRHQRFSGKFEGLPLNTLDAVYMPTSAPEAPKAAPSPEDKKRIAANYIDGLKAGAEKASLTPKSSERDDSRLRRIVAREKAGLAQQAKEDREELKQYLRAGYNSAASLADRYDNSAFGQSTRKAASWVGSLLKSKKPLSEQAKKATRKLSQQNKQPGNQKGKKTRWIVKSVK